MPEIITGVFMCRFDSGELCCICTRFIKPSQRFVRSESKVAHYKCAKKRHWKRESRAKPKKLTRTPIIHAVKIIKKKNRETT